MMMAAATTRLMTTSWFMVGRPSSMLELYLERPGARPDSCKNAATPSLASGCSRT